MTDVTTRQSTPEEIEARRAEVAATICKGDKVHSDMPSWHDWRLWNRDPLYGTGGDLDPEDELTWLIVVTRHEETWYCTRCRKIEKRTVMLDGS
jgi:hypothetical protein